eukprot:5458959-Lingulodinium_polyedra.AAC.1
MKSTLGAVHAEQGTRGLGWSKVRDTAHEVMQRCLQGWDSGLAVQGDPDRYSPPSARPDAPTAADARAYVRADNP